MTGSDVNKERIAVLIIDNSPVLGGAELYTTELAERADRRKYRFVFAITSRARISFLEQKGFVYEFFRTGKLKTLNPVIFFTGILNSVHDLLKIIRHQNIDILQANTVRTHIIGALVSILSRKPIIWVHHQFDFSPLPFRLLSFIPKKIICVSDTTRDHYAAYLTQKDKLDVIYNGIDVTAYRGSNSKKKVVPYNAGDDIHIGTVGRIERRKGQEYFIRAIPEIIRYVPNAKFYVIGDVGPGEDSYNNKIRALVDRSGLANTIEFTGFVENIRAMMSKLDILIQPSVEPESFGRVLIEAMALGKPVVATDIGAFKEIIQNGTDGILVDPRDHRQISSAVIRMIVAKDEMQIIGERAKKKVIEKYSLENNVHKYEILYDSLKSSCPSIA